MDRERFLIDDTTNDEILTSCLLGGEDRQTVAYRTKVSTGHVSNLIIAFTLAREGKTEELANYARKRRLSSRTIEYVYRRLGLPIPPAVMDAWPKGAHKKKAETVKEEEPVKEEIEQSDLHENDGAFYVNVLVKLERIANDLERLIRLWT